MFNIKTLALNLNTIKTLALNLNTILEETLYNGYIEELFNSGSELFVILTEKLKSDWKLKEDFIRLNLNNCKGFAVDKDGTLHMDISIKGNGGWYTLDRDEYIDVVSFTDKGKVYIPVKSMLLYEIMEEINGVNVKLMDGDALERKADNVVKVDFRKR